MADLFLCLTGLALSATGFIGILKPGTGREADRLMRVLQIVTGLIILIIGAAFLKAGIGGLVHG